MFENMSEFVGYAMHDDLLMRRMQDARVAEAQRAWAEQRRGERRRSYRDVVAMALVSLARWIAPSVTTSTVATAQ
jgi:Arc/MetJ-type ribon-helix-helix transcriptional regulator